MSDYDTYFDELMNNKETRDAHFKKEEEMWSKKPNRNIKFKLTPGQIDSLIGLKIIKEEKTNFWTCYTNLFECVHVDCPHYNECEQIEEMERQTGGGYY